MRTQLQLLSTTLFVLLLTPLVLAQSPKTEPVLQDCTVAIIDDVQIPAEANGVLAALGVIDGQRVQDGTRVKKGQVIAQLDDRREKMALESTRLEAKKAKMQKDNTVDIRYSRAVAEVAKATFDKAVYAHNRVRDSVPEVERRRLELDWKRAVLQIEQSEKTKDIEQFDLELRIQEFRAAEDTLARRKIISPIDGVVVTLFPKVGEWIQAGDPVVRIISLDKLRVDGFINIRDFAPDQVLGRDVTVSVRLTDDNPATFSGVIAFVHPEQQASGEYRVKAVVDNPDHRLRPGSVAQMTIHTGTRRVSSRSK